MAKTDGLEDPGARLVDFGELAKNLSGQVLPPTEMTSENSQKTEKTVFFDVDPNLVDAKNRPFDPKIHVTDPDGKPKLTKTGKLRVRPGADGPETPASTGGAPPLPPMLSPHVVLGSILSGLQIAFGPDWKPTQEESEQLQYWVQRYSEEKGFQDLSPGWGLLLVSICYAGPRLATSQETHRRVKPLTDKIQDLFINLWVKFKYRGNKRIGTQPDYREDQARKNTASDGSGGSMGESGNRSTGAGPSGLFGMVRPRG